MTGEPPLTYIIKPGDSLKAITERFGITSDKMPEFLRLNADKFKVDGTLAVSTVLKIPGPAWKVIPPGEKMPYQMWLLHQEKLRRESRRESRRERSRREQQEAVAELEAYLLDIHHPEYPELERDLARVTWRTDHPDTVTHAPRLPLGARVFLAWTSGNSVAAMLGGILHLAGLQVIPVVALDVALIATSYWLTGRPQQEVHHEVPYPGDQASE